MPLAPGTKVGAYEIVALLGAGGMGEVYRARDPRLGRDVAVKTVRGPMDRGRLKRLELEARAAAALNHPNVITVFDVGSDQDHAYVVTELLEGQSLRAVLRQGRLSVPAALDYARQIADALAAAHAKGIVHRDLKPENVFVLPGDRIKVLDFGLAKFVAAADGAGADVDTTAALTMAGAVVGTPAYLAPEQARGGVIDHRADIFGFGAVLYEMLAGASPFRASTLADTLIAILRDPAPPLPRDVAAAAPGLVPIVRRCLEKDPQARFQSAGDLRVALEGVAPQRRPRSRAVYASVAAIVALVVVGGIVWRTHLVARWMASRPSADGGGRRANGRIAHRTIDVKPELIAPVRAGRSTLQTRVADVFPSAEVALTPRDATHVDVAAREEDLPSVVSVIQLANTLQGHRFFDEPSLTGTGSGTTLLFKGASKLRVSLLVRNASLRGLLQLIAGSLGWPVIFESSVGGAVTLTMTDGPWDLIVESCLRYQGADLVSIRYDDVWFITSRTRLDVMPNLGIGVDAVWFTRSRRIPPADLVRAFEPARTEKGLVAVSPRLDAVVVVDRTDALPDYARILATIDGTTAEAYDFNVERPRRRYQGGRVDFEFRNDSVEQIIRRFASLSGLNIVLEPTVAQHLDPATPTGVTGTVANVPWDNTLDVVLRAAHLVYRIDGNLVHVYPFQKALEDWAASPLRIETITLAHEAPAFFEPFSRYLSPRGALSIEQRTRTVVVRDEIRRVAILTALIHQIDDRTAPVDPRVPANSNPPSLPRR